MKVLMINGSANVQGCTYTALKEIEKELNAQNIETEIVSLGNKPIRDCMGCCSCRNTASNTCVFEDDIIKKLLDIKWWEWEDSLIEKYADSFTSPDSFIKKIIEY